MSYFDNSDRNINIDPVRILKVVPLLVGALVLIVFLLTSWITIQPEELGVVLRLGKHDRTLEPGLHFKIPFGIDQVHKVPVRRQMKQEFGFRTELPGTRTTYSDDAHDQESLMLTGDLNVADVEWVTQYRIGSPYDYLFKVRSITETFRSMNEAVMREIIGDHSINEVLTTGRVQIESRAMRILQERVRQYEMGIEIDQIILQDVNPPQSVKPAFNEVNQAQQEKEKLINEARQEYNKIIPKARGDANKVVEEAHGYAVERINRAEGEAARFNDILAEYQKAPEVTRNRIYLETMSKVMSQVGKKTILDEQAQGILPLLNLNSDQSR